MKWFKHYSDNYRGRSIEALYEELGHAGISCYYILTEICAEKLNSTGVKHFEEDGHKLSFSVAFVRRNLRLSEAKMQRLFNLCAELGLFFCKIDQKDVHIEYPILLELLHSDTTKSRSRREQDVTKSRLEREEKKKEIKNKILPNTKISDPQKTLRDQTWESYRAAFASRYGVEPIRNAKINSQVKQFVDRVGSDAPSIAAFYLTHNDQFYVRKTHDVGLLLQNAESLGVQWRGGAQITSQKAREIERDFENRITPDVLAEVFNDRPSLKDIGPIKNLELPEPKDD